MLSINMFQEQLPYQFEEIATCSQWILLPHVYKKYIFNRVILSGFCLRAHIHIIVTMRKCYPLCGGSPNQICHDRHVKLSAVNNYLPRVGGNIFDRQSLWKHRPGDARAFGPPNPRIWQFPTCSGPFNPTRRDSRCNCRAEIGQSSRPLRCPPTLDIPLVNVNISWDYY